LLSRLRSFWSGLFDLLWAVAGGVPCHHRLLWIRQAQSRCHGLARTRDDAVSLRRRWRCGRLATGSDDFQPQDQQKLLQTAVLASRRCAVETFGDDVYRNEYKRLRKNHKDQEDAKKAATELSGAFLKAASRSKLFWYFIGIPIIAIIIWNLAQGLGIGALVLLLFVILILLGGLKFKQWYNNE
jgi:hypothetical protein